MTVNQLIRYYGDGVQAAFAIGVSKQAVSKWKKTGIPVLRQHYIQSLTDGDLKAVKEAA